MSKESSETSLQDRLMESLRLAIQNLEGLLSRVGPQQEAWPTPCSKWSVIDLVRPPNPESSIRSDWQTEKAT